MGLIIEIEQLKMRVLDSLNEPAIILNDKGIVTATNSAWKKEQPHKHLIELETNYITMLEHHPHIIDKISNILLGEDNTFIFELNNYLTSFTLQILPIKDDSSKIIGVLLNYSKDNTIVQENKNTDFFQLIAEYSKDMIKVTDAVGNVEYASPSHEIFLGYVDYSNIFEYTHPDDLINLKSLYSELINNQKTSQLEFRKKNKNKEWVWVEAVCTPIQDKSGNVVNILLISRDISERKHMQLELEHLAYQDHLTGLYNRRKMSLAMDECLIEGSRNQEKFAFIVMDLDKFKSINDTYGHDIGDRVLIEFSHRLLVSKRNNDIVGRLSGDEFSIVMKDVNGIEDIKQHLLNIHKALNEPFKIPELGLEIQIKASTGYSLFPDDGETVSVLLKHADNALYNEKRKRIKIVKSVSSKYFKNRMKQ